MSSRSVDSTYLNKLTTLSTRLHLLSEKMMASIAAMLMDVLVVGVHFWKQQFQGKEDIITQLRNSFVWLHVTSFGGFLYVK